MAQYEDCIVFLLAKAHQRAHGVLKRRLQAYGLTPVQHLILEALWDEEGLSAGDIGKRLVLDTATLSGVLDRMAESGWVDKQTDAEDRRVLRLYLSPKAENSKTALIEERKRANDEILSGMRLEEKVLLKRLLRDVRA
jgi:DNA-binding MarR family transcriptional regulator